MDLKLGDVQTTALIPVAVKANESRRKNARVYDDVAVQIVRTLGLDTKPYDKSKVSKMPKSIVQVMPSNTTISRQSSYTIRWRQGLFMDFISLDKSMERPVTRKPHVKE